MFKKLSDNLNMLMAKARLNSNELAKLTGLPATTIKRIRNNDQSNPTLATLIPIANYFAISLSQLVGDGLLDLENKNYDLPGLQQIPLLTWRECTHYQKLDYEKHHKKIYTERKISKKGFALVIEDQDLDFFPKNSLVIVEPEKTPEPGDHVIVSKIEQGMASIKKYIVEIDQIYLKSLIAGLGISLLTAEYQILGVVIQCKLELKT